MYARKAPVSEGAGSGPNFAGRAAAWADRIKTNATRSAAKLPQLVRALASSSANTSSRTWISRIGILTTVAIALLPPMGYAAISWSQLKQHALEQASVGARHVEFQLGQSTAGEWVDQVSVGVLFATTTADHHTVVASWITDPAGKTLMFQGEAAHWLEVQGQAPIRATKLQGAFHVSLSGNGVLSGTLNALLIFGAVAVAAHYAFRRLPLSALDQLRQEIEKNESERRAEGDAAAAAAARFQGALDALLEAVAIFDAGQQLLACNSRYLRLFALTPEQARPGTPLRDLIEAQIKNNLFFGADPEEYRAQQLKLVLAASKTLASLSDGRRIAVCRTPLPDGSVVATFDDLNARQRHGEWVEFLASMDPTSKSVPAHVT
jgi:PAS domain-containing protein